MDLRRLRAGEWIAGVSGVVLLASLFLPWYEVDSTGVNAFEAYSAVDILLVLVAAMGIAVFIAVAMQKSAAVGIALEALVTTISGVVAIVVLVRVLNMPDGLGEASRTAWMALGALATLGVCVGSLVAMRDERLSQPGQPTDSAGAPAEPRPIEVIRSP